MSIGIVNFRLFHNRSISEFRYLWIALLMRLPPGEQTIHDKVAGFGGLSKVKPQMAAQHIENAKGH